MKNKDLSNQISATYKMLRLGVAVIAFAFPLLLWVGGHLFAGLPLAGSMSAYYYSVMRDTFVGILFAVGVILFVYQGYTRFEDWALNLAGGLALGSLSSLWPCPPRLATIHFRFMVFARFLSFPVLHTSAFFAHPTPCP